jgi:phage gp29-like protein
LLTYAEVWALPGVIGKMSNDVAAAFDQNTLASFETMLREFAGDSRQILPPGFDVQVMSAVSGGERVFDLLDKLTERQIQFAIVGQVGTASGDQSTYASAAVGMQVQNTLVAGDERMVGDALERLLLSAVTLRFGRGVPAGEVVFRDRASEASAEDKAKLLQSAVPALVQLLDKGVSVDVEEYAKLFGIPLAAPQEPT